MIKKILIIIILALNFILISCSTPTEVTSEEIIPTPKPGTGVLYGYLLNKKNDPIRESIFLSQEIAQGNPDIPITVSFSVQSDPRGIINMENGFFVFENIEPGDNYVISILVGSGEPVFVMDESGQKPLIFSIAAGETKDLGKLIVEIN